MHEGERERKCEREVGEERLLAIKRKREREEARNKIVNYKRVKTSEPAIRKNIPSNKIIDDHYGPNLAAAALPS